MSLEERLEKAEKLVAEVKAELAAMRAEKATKRNWPERIEAGMVFRHGNVVHMVDTSGALVMIHGDQPGGKWVKWERAPLEYLGTSFAVLTIRTDAHEPTGAEFLGKCCDFSDDGITWPYTAECEATSLRLGYTWGAHESWYKFARLAK